MSTRLPSVSLYIRRNSVPGRPYERVRRRNPQVANPGDQFCLHVWNPALNSRKWIAVGTDIVAAERQRRRKEDELLTGKPASSSASSGKIEQSATTLKELRNKFLNYKRTSSKRDGTSLDDETIDAYEAQTQEFITVCGVLFPAEVTGQSLRDYMADLRRRGFTHRTVCNKYDQIAAFLKFCGVDHKALLPYSERPAPDDPPVEPYDQAMLQVCFSQLRDERHRLGCEVLLKAGLREREMTTLEWSDLNLGKTPEVSIQARKPHLNFRTKTGKGRRVPLEKNLALKLSQWRVKNPETTLVFGTASGKEDTHFFRHVTEAFERAGLPVPKRPLHRFRDTFGTTVARSGKVDLRTLQAWMGHASIIQTQKYIFPCQGEAAQTGINATFEGLRLEGALAATIQ